MVDVESGDEDELRVSSYALVLEIPRGGTPAIRSSSTCDDVLVRRDGVWLVKDRRIKRDDLPR